MDSRPNRPRSWNDLLRAARQAPPPDDLDVRVSVRRGIEAVPTRVLERQPGLLADLVLLTQAAWLRRALAVVTAGNILIGWCGLDALSQLAFVLELQGLLVTAL